MRAKPSSLTSVITPTPSTCPSIICPPSRASARSASSRLTRVPASTSFSDERRSVSCMTSKPKRCPQMPVAVRHTPLTATLSPSPTSCARRDSTVSTAPSPVRSTATTVPRSSTNPVNIGLPLSQACADQDVAGDHLAVERQRAQRVGDALDALALERVAGLAAAEQQRRQEEPDLVDLARVEEAAAKVRAPLQEDRGDPLLAELVERGADAGRLVLAGGDDDVGATGLQ